MKNSFKLFEMDGTPVYLKYWFFLLFLFLSLKMMFVIFVSVLVHEIAHAWVAKKLGYRVNKIFLDIFHGAAEIDLNYLSSYKDTIRIIAAGPLSNAAIVLIFSCLIFSGLVVSPALVSLSKLFIVVNLLISIFNMLPIYPLDGGRISKAILMRYLGPKGQFFSGILSMSFSVMLFTYSLINFDLLLIFFSLIFIFLSYHEIRGKDELNNI